MSTNSQETAKDIEQRCAKRLDFLNLLFPSQNRGYFCLARISRREEGLPWRETFLKLPLQRDKINNLVEEWIKSQSDVYFCPHLLSGPVRRKDYALPGHILWADLDECPLRTLGRYGEPRPQIIVSTSLAHHQSYWLLDHNVGPLIYENLNRRIAFAYSEDGCDQGGWDITQMLRMPETLNYKRERPERVWRIIDTSETFTPSPVQDMDSKLPVLRPLSPVQEGISADMSYKHQLHEMDLAERILYFKDAPAGERSEHIYALVRLLKYNLGFGDGLVVKTLCQHKVLLDKWPKESDRIKDIQRCLTKAKKNN